MKFKKIRIKPSRLIKRLVAIFTPFLIMLGAGIIVNTVFLASKYSEINFLIINPVNTLAYIFALAFMTFLIYELNQKIQNSGSAIGLVLSIVFSLPLIIAISSINLPTSIVTWNIINNIFSITLASYVFNTMWG